MSNVYWAFKNYSSEIDDRFKTVTFEGPAIQCIDLKRAILQQTRKENGKDIKELNFGLVIEDPQKGIVYRNDFDQIKRNSSVIVKRVPLRSEQELQKLTIAPQTKILPSMHSIVNPKSVDPLGPAIFEKPSEVDVETTKLHALMQSNVQQNRLKENEQRASGKWRGKGGWKNSGPPPPHYVCYACNTPGHWKDECPNRNKKNTVEVEAPRTEENQGEKLIAMALRRSHGLFTKKGDKKKERMFLKPYSCSLCENLFRKPTITPCCKQSFCDECIRQHLIHNDRYTCPVCQQRIDLGDLELNQALNQKVLQIREKLSDPNADTEQYFQEFIPSRQFVKHSELPSVSTSLIPCLKCGESGHMFKNCPNSERKEIIESTSKIEIKAEPMDSPPNLLLNPTIINPPNPTILPLPTSHPSVLQNLMLGGGIVPPLGGGIPPLESLSQMLKKSKRKRRRSRSRSRDRRSRRKGRRRRSDSRTRGRSESRSRRSRRRRDRHR